MELVKGYKQTELGIFPEDWNVISIDKIFTFYSTSNYSKAQMSFDGDVGCIHYGLIHAIPNTCYNVRKGIKYFITQEQAKYETIKNGDIVMVDASEDLDGINKSVELSGIENGKYIAGLHTFLLRDTNSLLANNFRGAILNSKIIKNQMLRLAVGMKVFGVSKPQLKTILIPVPPFPEQTSIANALSNIDEVISLTEKLIDKKKAIKQGVMQELLKPKEGWVKVSIKEISKVGRGRVINQNEIQKSLGGKYPVYSSQTSNYGIMGFIDSYDFDGEYITWTTDGENAGTVFYRNGKFNCTNVCGTIKLKNFNARFIAYVLAIEAPKHVSRNLANPKLMNEPMKNIEILIPSDINTQSKIASILLTIENEIDLHVGKLNKLKLKKQGMMQALLTGKIRML